MRSTQKNMISILSNTELVYWISSNLNLRTIYLTIYKA